MEFTVSVLSNDLTKGHVIIVDPIGQPSWAVHFNGDGEDQLPGNLGRCLMHAIKSETHPCHREEDLRLALEELPITHQALVKTGQNRRTRTSFAEVTDLKRKAHYRFNGSQLDTRETLENWVAENAAKAILLKIGF